MTSDLELLGRFAREKSQDAFTALVNRHVNLVYSAALRQVRAPQAAEDVAQSVFADLARSADALVRGSDAASQKSLTPWLYAVTRRTAIDAIRKESRRRLREQIAVEMNDMNATANEWIQIEPLLDDALAALDETDRNAILLRYFENKTLREVGEALGTNDDAAQKRVSRAVEILREFFAKHKVTVGASGLAVLISANAVQSAPAGLAATISAAGILAGTAVHTSTVIAATKTIAMTTLQKTIIAVALTTAIGTGIFEAHQKSESQKLIPILQQQQNSLNDQLAQLQRERDDATNRLDGLIAENAQLKSSSSEQELLKLRGQVGVAAQVAADATAKMQSLGTNSAPSQLEAERNETRAHLRAFFNLANLPPDKADQYVNLEVDMQQRQDARLKALLAGTLSVADAVRQRDQDNQQQQDQRRELLGPDGSAVLQSIADGMRNNVAKGLVTTIQANMGDNPLTQEQSNQLQGAIKAEVAANTMDDADLFRPVDEWTQMVTTHEQNVLQAASGFLTSAQLGTLQSLEEQNLKLLLQKRDLRIKALGIKQ